MSQPEPEPFDHVMVYVSEQTNQRRPGVRLVCTCGWGIVAVHADQTRPLAQIIGEATAHAEVCR